MSCITTLMSKILFTLAFCFLIYLSAFAQTPTPIVVGAMKNVMWKGELQGIIKPDTLSYTAGLYGLGPIAYLKGEILVLDGVVYTSYVKDANTMLVKANAKVSAPFFAYSNISEWTEVYIPSSVKDLTTLEAFLNQHFSSVDVPFFFKLEGEINRADIHIVNLPEGSTVKNPQEAHQGQVNYKLSKGPCTLLGFFSRKHKTVFTHHDTFLHIHLMTAEKDKMGHLEQVDFQSDQMKLFVPKGLK